RRTADEDGRALREPAAEQRIEVPHTRLDARDAGLLAHGGVSSPSWFRGGPCGFFSPVIATFESAEWSAGVMMSSVRLPRTVSNSTRTNRNASVACALPGSSDFLSASKRTPSGSTLSGARNGNFSV